MDPPFEQHSDVWFQEPPTGQARLAALTRRLDRLRTREASEPSDGGLAVGELDLASPVRAADGTALTTKELAARRGTSLWELERSRSDARGSAPRTAPVTASERTSATAASPATATRGGSGTGLVLAAITVLIVIRFFTEVVPVLPRPVQFIDIPIFLTIVGAAFLRPRSGATATDRDQARRVAPILVIVLLFVLVCAGSTLTNLSRIDLAPVLVFLYGFASPLVVFLAVHRMWPVGATLRMSRLLVALGLLQIGVAFTIDLPLFLADGNPDVFSGTFGENAYQLVFFLLVLIGLFTGIFTFEKQRPIARFVPVLLVAMLAITFLAQYRALLLTMALTVVLLGVVLTRSGSRGAIAAIVAAAALLATLSYTAQNIPGLKFGSTVEQARDDPTFYLKKRLQTTDYLLRLFADQSRFTITGAGPGTYSSRAWRTFAYVPTKTEAVGDYVIQLTSGRRYSTDVSDKYVLPQLTAEIVGGSRSVTSPLSSYLSLLAEVGVLGFCLIIGAYVWAFVVSLRMTLASIRTAKPGDPLPALLCASTVAFFVLLQMAFLENWLEVTRITFPSWALLAVVAKEFTARTRDAR